MGVREVGDFRGVHRDFFVEHRGIYWGLMMFSHVSWVFLRIAPIHSG